MTTDRGKLRTLIEGHLAALLQRLYITPDRTYLKFKKNRVQKFNIIIIHETCIFIFILSYGFPDVSNKNENNSELGWGDVPTYDSCVSDDIIIYYDSQPVVHMYSRVYTRCMLYRRQPTSRIQSISILCVCFLVSKIYYRHLKYDTH